MSDADRTRPAARGRARVGHRRRSAARTQARDERRAHRRRGGRDRGCRGPGRRLDGRRRRAPGLHADVALPLREREGRSRPAHAGGGDGPSARVDPRAGRDGAPGSKRSTRAQVLGYLRHPWVLDVPISGSPTTPNSAAWMDAGLEALADTPFTHDERLVGRARDHGPSRTGAGRVLAAYARVAARDGRGDRDIARARGRAVPHPHHRRRVPRAARRDRRRGVPRRRRTRSPWRRPVARRPRGVRRGARRRRAA